MNARDYELKILERLLSRAKDRRVLWQLLLTKELSRLLRFAARLPPDVMSKVIAKELSSCANVTFEQVTRLVDNAVGIDAKKYGGLPTYANQGRSCASINNQRT